MASSDNQQASLMLKKQLIGLKPSTFLNFLIELTKNPVEGFSAGLVDEDDIYRWDIMILGPPDTE